MIYPMKFHHSISVTLLSKFRSSYYYQTDDSVVILKNSTLDGKSFMISTFSPLSNNIAGSSTGICDFDRNVDKIRRFGF
jgi:hypothetical protein